MERAQLQLQDVILFIIFRKMQQLSVRVKFEEWARDKWAQLSVFLFTLTTCNSIAERGNLILSVFRLCQAFDASAQKHSLNFEGMSVKENRQKLVDFFVV